jgi:predicted metallopeptidase
MIYQLNYGIEYLGLGKVMCKYAYNSSSAYLRGTWLKTKKYQAVKLAYLRYVYVRELSHPGLLVNRHRVMSGHVIFKFSGNIENH